MIVFTCVLFPWSCYIQYCNIILKALIIINYVVDDDDDECNDPAADDGGNGISDYLILFYISLSIFYYPRYLLI